MSCNAREAPLAKYLMAKKNTFFVKNSKIAWILTNYLIVTLIKIRGFASVDKIVWHESRRRFSAEYWRRTRQSAEERKRSFVDWQVSLDGDREDVKLWNCSLMINGGPRGKTKRWETTWINIIPLSGYGYFRSYLHKMYCVGSIFTAQRTTFAWADITPAGGQYHFRLVNFTRNRLWEIFSLEEHLDPGGKYSWVSLEG